MQRPSLALHRPPRSSSSLLRPPRSSILPPPLFILPPAPSIFPALLPSSIRSSRSRPWPLLIVDYVDERDEAPGRVLWRVPKGFFGEGVFQEGPPPGASHPLFWRGSDAPGGLCGKPPPQKPPLELSGSERSPLEAPGPLGEPPGREGRRPGAEGQRPPGRRSRRPLWLGVRPQGAMNGRSSRVAQKGP